MTTRLYRSELPSWERLLYCCPSCQLCLTTRFVAGVWTYSPALNYLPQKTESFAQFLSVCQPHLCFSKMMRIVKSLHNWGALSQVNNLTIIRFVREDAHSSVSSVCVRWSSIQSLIKGPHVAVRGPVSLFLLEVWMEGGNRSSMLPPLSCRTPGLSKSYGTGLVLLVRMSPNRG